LRELFDDHGVEPEVVDASAAELLGHVEADEPVFSCGHVGFAVDEALALPLLGVGRALFFEKLTRSLPQLLVLGFEYQSLQVLSYCSLLLGYLAFQTGCRFSANASGPSFASSDLISAVISRMVLAQPGSSPVMTPSSTPLATRLLADTASGALTVFRSASASAASTAVPSGTTSLIRPHFSASAELIGSPVNSSSIATLRGRGSTMRNTAPAAAMSPRLTSGGPHFARSSA